MALALLGPVWFALWAVRLLAPPLAPFLIPADLAIGALWLALGMLDYPLSLRGLRWRARLRLIARGSLAVFGFAAGCAVLFGVPGLGLLVLPIAVVAAAELAVLLERDPRSPR
jgi:uncharacterized protein involved in cysteine biosynthesis